MSTALHDVAHAPATPKKVSIAPPSPAAAPGPVTGPGGVTGPVIPEVGVPVQRSPFTAEPPVVTRFPSPIDDLNGEVPVIDVADTAPAAAQPQSPAAAPTAQVHVQPPTQPTPQPEPKPEPQVDPRVSGGLTPPPVIDAPPEPQPEPAAKSNIAPSVLKKAEKHGIDVSQLVGSGSGGKVVGRDVDAAIAARDAAAPPVTEQPVAEQPAPVEPPVAEQPAPVEPPVAEQPAPADPPVAETAPVTPPVAEQPAASAAPVTAPEPAHAEATTADEQPAPAVESPAVGGNSPAELVTLRIALTTEITVADLSDTSALSRIASDHLPNLMVVSVGLHMTPAGNELLVNVNPTVAVTL